MKSLIFVIYFAFAVFITALSISSYASSTSSAELRFGGWSKHLSENQDYNETHNAFLFEYKKLMVGYFRNSYNSDTAALAYIRHWRIAEDLRFQMTAGLMYGYRDCLEFTKEAQEKTNSKNVCPMVYPEIRFDAPLRPGVGLLGNAVVVTFGVEL